MRACRTTVFRQLALSRPGGGGIFNLADVFSEVLTWRVGSIDICAPGATLLSTHAEFIEIKPRDEKKTANPDRSEDGQYQGHVGSRSDLERLPASPKESLRSTKEIVMAESHNRDRWPDGLSFSAPFPLLPIGGDHAEVL